MTYIKKATIGYLAGLLDGEGCVTVIKYKRNDRQNKNDYYALRLTITNTNRDALKLFHDTFKSGYIYAEKRPNCKLIYVWASSATAKNKAILKGLLPYLIIKKDKAKLAIRLHPKDLYEQLHS